MQARRALSSHKRRRNVPIDETDLADDIEQVPVDDVEKKRDIEEDEDSVEVSLVPTFEFRAEYSSLQVFNKDDNVTVHQVKIPLF